MKRFKRGEKGFTLVELLIVVAILGILAAVVIPNVVGLMGRGGAQAYETDQEVNQLAAATFYSDVHQSWNDVSNDDDPAIPANYSENTWGANGTDEDASHYYPTAIAVVNGHVLIADTNPANNDSNNANNPRLNNAGGTATDVDVSNHAVWMGLLVEAPGENVAPTAAGLATRGTVSVLETEGGLYLQEMPESASGDNGSLHPGSYTWVVGKNGTVYGVYAVNADEWYIGFSGGYP